MFKPKLTTIKAMLRLMQLRFEEIGFKYEALTAEERELIDEETFQEVLEAMAEPAL